MIGCELGKRRDQVQAARVEGENWRKRHDSIKMMLSRLLRWAKMPFQCEVFNRSEQDGEGEEETRTGSRLPP